MTVPWDMPTVFLNGDEIEITLPSAEFVVTRFYARVQQAPSGGDLTIRLAKASGASPAGDTLTLTIQDGTTNVDLAETVAAGWALSTSEKLYIRVLVANGSGFASGWIEFSTSDPAQTALTTVAKVQTVLGPKFTDTALIQSVIDGVSLAIENYIARTIGSTLYTSELHSASGRSDGLVLNEWPLISITEVKVSGDVVAATGYLIDNGVLRRRDAGLAVGWERGTSHIEVTYTAGFAVIPADIDWVTQLQTSYMLRQTQPGGNRLGLASVNLQDAENFIVEDWHHGVRSVIDTYRRVA